MKRLSRKMKNRFTMFGVLLIILVVISIPISIMTNTNEYAVTITEKERVLTSSGSGENKSISSKYLIFTETDNGEIMVFENTDNLFYWKWDSSTIYGKLKVGSTYKIKTYGYRIPFFSWYENIVEVK